MTLLPAPLRIADFRLYWIARFAAVLATMGMVVIIGYQVYDLARADPSAGGYGMSIRQASFQLGLLGLAQFVPLALLTPVAGWVADRFERRTVARLAQLADLVLLRRNARHRARFRRPRDVRHRPQYRPAEDLA